MPTIPSTPRNDRSIKLSVTVKRRLERKYNPAALQQIDGAVKRWIEADDKRGIQTVHVAVDDPTDKNMKELGLTPVSGKATPEKIKQAIKHLWDKLEPDYLVLFGGDDVVPMFEVPNPTFGWPEDTEKTVPSDNPYATRLDFSRSDPRSYVVPDRPIGRIPDMVSAPNDTARNSDPAWLLDYLETATNWKPQDENFYKLRYAICTGEAKDAATEFMQKAFAKRSLTFICPPISDNSTPARNRLSARLHVIKCHGNRRDATFWGYESADEENQKGTWKPALTSATLKARLKPSTVVAAMCCFGAQIFSPFDPKAKPPGAWPVASTYLRKGALGFVGSTRMAWVGRSDMGPADWIVQSYLKNILAGASLGGAFLACKQDYHSHYTLEDHVYTKDEQKTLVEYILLGDPSIHPVSSPQISAGGLAVPGRRRRRAARVKLAAGICEFLPTRSRATPKEKAMAKAVFESAKRKIAKGDIKKFKEFGIKATHVQVERVNAPVPVLPETSKDPRRDQMRKSLQYYWCGQRHHGGGKQHCVLKAETDRQGILSRASVMYTS